MEQKKESQKKKHHEGHRERLRQRFLDAPEKLSDYELLELLLGHVLIRCDTKPLAKELLAKFGSIREILDGKIEEIRTIKGIGPSVETYLRLVREVLVRHAESPLKNRKILCTPQNIAVLARKRLAQASVEEVWVAYVNNANRLISWEKVAQGSISKAFIAPRDILERAILLRASGFIIVHNHPSGIVKPSGADISLTDCIKQASSLIEIRFLDHVIVTENASYSMLEEGLI